MSRRHHFKNNDTPTPSGDELIFYCDCNNNIVDQISGVNLATLYSYFAINYADDPTDSSRKVMNKPSGTQRRALIIGNYNISGTTDDAFIFCQQSNYTDETTRKWLASPTYGNHRVEFDWYPSSNTRQGCTVFDSSGLSETNANSSNYGMCLFKNNNDVIIRARNNSSANLDTIVGNVSSLAGKWYNVVFDFTYINSSSYSITVTITDIATDTVISTVTRTLSIPMTVDRFGRSMCLFLSDNPGNGGWADNPYDYIKEVKVWKKQNSV